MLSLMDSEAMSMGESVWQRLQALWHFPVFTIGGHPITPGTIAISIAVVLLGVLVASLLSKRALRLLVRLKVNQGAAQALQSLVYYALVAVALLIAMQVAGVPITVFTFFGGALALGLGFGSQNLVNNFLSGLVLLIERPLQVGDLIEIQGVGGRVQKIGARCTVITDYSGVAHLIPNSILLENRLTNWNLEDDFVVVPITVGVVYGSDTQAVVEILQGAAHEHRLVVPQPEPRVLFRDFGDNALVFELLVWIHARSSLERKVVSSELRFAIDDACRKRGVVIAFPQRDVHLDVARPIPVAITRDGGTGP